MEDDRPPSASRKVVIVRRLSAASLNEGVRSTTITAAAKVIRGYDPVQFAHIKGSIASLESICHHAIFLYVCRLNSGGTFEPEMKTSYAKQILLHHPGRSLQTTRNMVSVAAKLQERQSKLLGIWYSSMKPPYVLSSQVSRNLLSFMRERLASNGLPLSMPGIESYLR